MGIFNNKRIFISGVIFLTALNLNAAGVFNRRPREINPDYSQSVWDIIMKDQSVSDIRKGMYMMSVYKYEEAVNAFAKAVVKNPKDPQAYLYLGMALYWTGRVDNAMSQYNYALKLDKNSGEAHQLLGIAYGWKGDIKTATQHFEIADSMLQRADIKMNLSSSYSAQNRMEDALDFARQAVNLMPNEPLYHHQLGVLLESMGRDTLAEESFKKSIKLFPGYEDSMLALAATYEKRGQNEEALKYYKRAVNVKPGDFVARLRYANLLFATGNLKTAQDVTEKAFAITSSKGKGLALNLAYSSVQNESGQSTTKPLNDQLENLKNALSRFSPGDEIEVDAEISFAPKSEFKETKEITAMEKEFLLARQQAAAQNAKSFRRSFILNSGPQEQRTMQIETIVNALQSSLDGAPKDTNPKLNIKTEILPNNAAALNTGETNQRTAYNPRSVGNDMGLWVTGKGWMRFVEEGLYDIENRLEDKPENFDYILLGLARLTAGQGPQAYEAFKDAYSKGADKELALLGQGTALVIMGHEDEAKKVYENVLAVNPKSKTAKNNLSFLNKE
ncbi:tetratricopeptide (TPR) repeat protein [Elusimicrobium posterum]|uniref:tetratricopeptide repeat protein n=1 Tax=Elusimicrobium posterum TaxID=3116653 RepID=UPI003C792A4B